MRGMEGKPLSKKHQKFINEYLKCWNGAEAARRAGYSERNARDTASDLLTNSDILRHIQTRLDEVHMSADEALKLTADIARGDLGVFFKPIDEWVFNPLASYEILDEREVIDDTKEPPEKRISYRVRHVALDMDKLIDPQYSWMLKSFSDSSKFGLKIETHDKAAAIRDVLKIHGKFVDRHDVTSGGQAITKVDDEQLDRAILTFANAIGKIVSSKGTE
jgi:phage terminase small subunit